MLGSSWRSKKKYKTHWYFFSLWKKELSSYNLWNFLYNFGDFSFLKRGTLRPFYKFLIHRSLDLGLERILPYLMSVVRTPPPPPLSHYLPIWKKKKMLHFGWLINRIYLLVQMYLQTKQTKFALELCLFKYSLNYT